MQGTSKLEICSGCGKLCLIQNKTLKLCKDCVYKKNHGGKSQAEVLMQKKRDKPIKLPKPIKCKTYTYKRKNTGEKQLFLQIWNERKHICENCGVNLGEIPKSFMFAHIKAKSIEPGMRLDKNNIRLLCWDCHYSLDFRGQQYYEERKDRYRK